MNAYLNKRNERARWRRTLQRFRSRGQSTVNYWVANLHAYGALDKRNGGVGIPDNLGPKR